MRKLIFTLSVLFIAFSLTAQQKSKKQKNDHWKNGGFISLNAGQGGGRNWAPGAERFSFQGSAMFNYFANYKKDKHSLENEVDLAYGMVNTTSGGIRKSQDKIDVLSKYGYAISDKVKIGGWFNLRTQFSDGFDYSESPRRRISGIMAPGYITLAPGFEWIPCKSGNLTIFATPVMARMVVVTNRPYSYNYQGGVKPDGSNERSLADKYGIDPERQVDGQVGAMASIGYKKTELIKNVDLRTRIDFFTDYIDKEPWNVDVFLNSLLTMKVNNWLQVTYSFSLIYDDNQKQFGPLKNKAEAQMNSMLGVGLCTNF
ncbi:MAG: DUF3078 domain-containing protein [Terrimonas sp.]|nr:DUF3078 domain-containing protein [Terrimonas sp.]